MGWYAMGLVDVLDYFPENHPQRPLLLKALQRLAPAVARYQDPKTGTWSLVMGQETRKGNYAEASGSSMFVYALAKGVRMGYLDKKCAAVARKGYDVILKTFVETGADGALAFNGTVSVGGLGGKPHRNGSFDYYLTEPLRKNDLKGVGALHSGQHRDGDCRRKCPRSGQNCGPRLLLQPRNAQKPPHRRARAMALHLGRAHARRLLAVGPPAP
nr:glycoside hydrolase family 88 protein [Hymenobacter siberiensis]